MADWPKEAVALRNVAALALSGAWIWTKCRGTGRGGK